MYHLPFPASIVASTRLGNLIGSGALDAARVAVSTYYIIFVGLGLFDLSFLLALKDVIPRIFSNDDAVRKIVSTVMPLTATFQLVDSTTSLCNGLLRGLGRQYIGGWVNLLVYYVVSASPNLYLVLAMTSAKWLLVLYSYFDLSHLWSTTSWTLGIMDWTSRWPCRRYHHCQHLHKAYELAKMC
jgi:Na+-driven multidrug efflux pump